ncbi:carbohydrate kinase, partial [bacterium]|nr:carbohydrate kinase [bacterium]
MCSRILIVGEILFDIYPNYKRLGGASFNFAYHLQNFGHQIAFVSRTGNDQNGREIRTRLRQHQFPTDFIQIDAIHPTGTVMVKVDEHGQPKFTIVDGVAYDFIQFEEEIREFVKCGLDMIYFGTLAQRQDDSRDAIQEILRLRQDQTLVFYDMNIREPFYDENILRQSLTQCNVLKLNDEECSVVKKMFDLSSHEEETIAQLMQRFKVDYVCVTKGERGSTLYHESQKYEPTVEQTTTEVTDTVGAGDAFAAVMAYGLLNGEAPSEIVGQASRFATAICSISGAIPTDNT